MRSNEELPKGWDGSLLEATILFLLAIATGIVFCADLVRGRPSDLSQGPEAKL